METAVAHFRGQYARAQHSTWLRTARPSSADGVTFAKVDTTLADNANLKKQFDIKSFPTLKIFFSGVPDERLTSGVQ